MDLHQNNKRNQTSHEHKVINSDDCKKEKIENPSDPTNFFDFPVETSLWDEEDDS